MLKLDEVTFVVKRILLYTGIQELIIFIIMILKNKLFSLKAYTDIAFIIGFSLFLIALLIYVMQTGFFDRMHYSFRTLLKKIRGEDSDDRYASMALSELVSIRFANLMVSSAIVTFSSFIGALFVS